MSSVKKADLERFKRTMSGLIEFAVIIEQASPSRRQKILLETESVDPRFLKKVLRKVVYFDELVYLEEGVLAEILAKVPPRLLAYAIKKSSPEFQKEVLKHLNYVLMKQTHDELDQIRADAPDDFILGAQRQILAVGRSLEAQNCFLFEIPDCPRFQAEKTKRRG